MAFKKTLAQRLFTFSSRIKSAASSHRTSPNKVSTEGIFRRYFHRQSAPTAAAPPQFLPTGEKLLEKLRGMDIARDRIRLDGLIPPPVPAPAEGNLTVADAKKILKLSQLETVKSRLSQIGKDCVSYSEFLEICGQDCSSLDLGFEFAQMLDQSGSVIVLGNVVFLKPNQVVKAIQALMPMPVSPNPNDPRFNELEQMEKHKAAIDKKAESKVRRELQLGLGYLAIQTAAFMRLTFWELSWDVMEPICFYVTSIYFMGGYGFFLKTSIEPSFEGFYQSRFSTKQKKIMKAQNFDFERYNELKRAFYPALNDARRV